MRMEQALEEINDAQTEDDELDEEDFDNLENAIQKLEPLSGVQFEELIALVNAQYDLAVYDAMSDLVSNGNHICDDCRREAELN